MRNQRLELVSRWKQAALGALGVSSIVGPVLFGALNMTSVRAQSLIGDRKPEAFEVASVRQNKSGPGPVRIGFPPGGRFIAQNATLRALIALAYGTPAPLPNIQVVGGPDWLDTDGFDVEGKTDTNFSETTNSPVFSVRGELMVRSLLADRFKLSLHEEKRDLPIYALILARSDGKLGPQMRPSAGADCPSPAPGTEVPVEKLPNLPPCGQKQPSPGRIEMRYVTVDLITRFLLPRVGRFVVDRTGLTGGFSLDLDFTPLPTTYSIGPRPAAAPTLSADDERETALFTAIQEQLGLKLQATRGPVNVLVVDGAEHPTPN